MLDGGPREGNKPVDVLLAVSGQADLHDGRNPREVHTTSTGEDEQESFSNQKLKPNKKSPRHITREKDTTRRSLERLGGRVALTLTLAGVNLPYLHAKVEPLEHGCGEAGRTRSGKECHDLGRGAVDCELGVNRGERHRERVVERSNERVLRNVGVCVGVGLRDGRDEGVVREEREGGNL